jgi:hypothetical protein
LSHYAGDENSECESRSYSSPVEDALRQSISSRNQRLDYFLHVFRDEIAKDSMYSASATASHEKLSRSPTFVYFVDTAHTITLEDPAQTFEDCADDYAHNLRAVGWDVKTSFEISTQRRIAKDMWLTLLSPPGRPNFDFLACHAFFLGLNALRNTLDVSKDAVTLGVTKKQIDAMQRITTATEINSQRLLDELAANKLPTGFSQSRDLTDFDTSTQFTRIGGNLLIDMVGALLTFPYFELLQRKFGDPTKRYPAPPGLVPIMASEIVRIRK